MIEVVKEVFGSACSSSSPPTREEVELLEILGCEVNTHLPQIYNRYSPFRTALYKDGTIWKAAVWNQSEPYKLVKATSLQTLKTKLELLC